MKKYLEASKRIISLFMIFLLLVQQFGCVTSAVIPIADLPAYYPKYAYAVHCRKSVYILPKIAVVHDTLSGKIYNPDSEILATGNFIHIYPSADSLVQIREANILSLPLSGILQVKRTEEAPGKTAALILGGIGLVLLVLAGIAFSSLHFSLDM